MIYLNCNFILKPSWEYPTRRLTVMFAESNNWGYSVDLLFLYIYFFVLLSFLYVYVW